MEQIKMEQLSLTEQLLQTQNATDTRGPSFSTNGTESKSAMYEEFPLNEIPQLIPFANWCRQSGEHGPESTRLHCRNNEVVTAHTFLLELWSPILKEKLKRGSNNPEAKTGNVDVQDFTKESISRVIDCIYTGNLSNVELNVRYHDDPNNLCVMDSIKFAVKFEMSGVIAKFKDVFKNLCYSPENGLFALMFLTSIGSDAFADTKLYIHQFLDIQTFG